MNELIKKVEQWVVDKGIKDGSSPVNQLHKMQEEVDELSSELYHLEDHPNSSEIKDRALMELGDVFITCIAMCVILGVKPFDVVSLAYRKISKRTGKMIKGMFVKSEDLPDER